MKNKDQKVGNEFDEKVGEEESVSLFKALLLSLI